MEQGKQTEIKIYIATCPECRATNFDYDEIHDYTCCKECGLVLIAPPECGRVFPGTRLKRLEFKLVTLECDECRS